MPSGNSVRARVFEWHRAGRASRRPDRPRRVGHDAQTINAYYNPTFNEVVFPAAILQPPFFDHRMPTPAVNYGGTLAR